jgi:hypothetical protein
VAWIAAGVLFVATIALAIVSIDQTSSANAWHKADQKATAQLALARSSIKSLNSQVSGLNTQLAAQATAKEKALDANTVLTKIVSSEQTVSGELNTCVSDLKLFISTVGSDLNSGNYDDPALNQEASTAGTDCNQAQSDNQALQASINGAGG